MVVFGTTPSLNGITFPATQVASADANTLDDYEEGTWTVEFYDASSGGNVSSTTGTGYYTKVGRVVTANFGINNISTAGMTSGNVFYFTLPFAPSNDNSGRIANPVILRVFTFPAGVSYAQVSLGAAAARGSMEWVGSGVNSTGLLVSSLASGTADLFINMTYNA
jgi:hypothetical protein